MTFEKIVETVSRVLTIVVIFLLTNFFYLGQKGFTFQDGKIFLVKEAHAALPQAAGNLVPSNFSMDEQFVLGNADAPVTIYEFSSLGCSHCSDFHLNVLPEIKKNFIDTGKVRLVFADFPIDRKSMQAAMVARCMPKEKYFDFLNLLYKKQVNWGLSFKTEKLLAGYAAPEGLSPDEVERCLKNDKVAEEIVALRQNAMEKLNIQGTPSFLIKIGDKEELIPGFMSYDDFAAILEKYQQN